MDDLISRAAAITGIGELIREYREKGEDATADGLILSRRYVVKTLPAVDAVPVEWLRDKMRGYASSLKSIETAALVMVMQMWQKEQEAR